MKAKITKRLLDGIDPREAGAKQIWDTTVQGFVVRVYSSGKMSFVLRYRSPVTGETRSETYGRFGEGMTVEQARAHASADKAQVRLGRDPKLEREEKEQRTKLPTVDALMTYWLEEKAKPFRKSWKTDLSRTERYIVPGLGDVPVARLTPAHVKRWHREIKKETPVEANRCVETLRAAWNFAIQDGALPDDAGDITRTVDWAKERSRERWLRREEVERLMEATRQEEDPFVRAAVPLFLLTGLRKNELLSAKWENVDLGRGEIRLPDTKSGEPQIRLLVPPVQRILEGLPRYEESPYIFPSPQDPTSPRDDIRKPWKRIRERADLLDITLHDLRRTAGSHMAQAGVPLEVIGKVLGHSHPGVTKVYARLASENEREALDALADRLGPALGVATPDDEAEGGRDAVAARVQALLEEADDPGALLDRLRHKLASK